MIECVRYSDEERGTKNGNDGIFPVVKVSWCRISPSKGVGGSLQNVLEGAQCIMHCGSASRDEPHESNRNPDAPS